MEWRRFVTYLWNDPCSYSYSFSFDFDLGTVFI